MKYVSNMKRLQNRICARWTAMGRFGSCKQETPKGPIAKFGNLNHYYFNHSTLEGRKMHKGNYNNNKSSKICPLTARMSPFAFVNKSLSQTLMDNSRMQGYKSAHTKAVARYNCCISNEWVEWKEYAWFPQKWVNCSNQWKIIRCQTKKDKLGVVIFTRTKQTSARNILNYH